MKNTNVSMIFA